VIITREAILDYWVNPARERKSYPLPPPAGFVYVSFSYPDIGFPDVETLTAAERELLRPVIAADPDILLHEIWTSEAVQ
jgi:hypothetical protein